MIDALLENNMRWARAKAHGDVDYFRRLSTRRNPQYLWIGCSDNTVSANEIVGLDRGDVLVHNNIANLAPLRDLNFLSVLQFAIEVAEVRHIIVCAHYGCDGVRAALEMRRRGLMDHWLQPVCALASEIRDELSQICDFETRVNVVSERNVCAQVEQLGRNPFLMEAWRRGRELAVHGWIYSGRDGLLRDLDLTVERMADVDRLTARNRSMNA